MKSKSKVVIGAFVVVVILVVFLITFYLPRWQNINYPGMIPAPPPPPDPLSEIDRILEMMEFGNIGFNAPRSMNLHDTALIHLVLSVVRPIEDLKQMIEAEGERIGTRIRVSDRMEARLTGSNFQITAITPETQAVTRTDVTEWKWEVKPKSAGRQHLHLTLSALLNLEGASTPRAIRTFDQIIDVEVSLGQRVTAFLQNNWQWLWAAILVPLAGWLWKRRRGFASGNQ